MQKGLGWERVHHGVRSRLELLRIVTWLCIFDYFSVLLKFDVAYAAVDILQTADDKYIKIVAAQVPIA